MKVTWEAEDGYVSGGRPQSVEVPDDEIEECESAEKAMELIYEYILEEFNERVSPGIRNGAEVEAAVAVMVARGD